MTLLIEGKYLDVKCFRSSSGNIRSRAIKLMEVSVTGFHFIFTFGHFLQLWNLSSLSNEPEASQFAKQKGRF